MDNIIEKTELKKTTLAPTKSSKLIQEKKGKIIQCLSQRTGYNVKDHSEIKWKTATRFYRYKIEANTSLVQRAFQKISDAKTQSIERKELIFHEDWLWTRDPELYSYPYLAKERSRWDISIALPESEGIHDCEECKGSGYATCSKCHGSTFIPCYRCEGVKIVADKCCKCNGKGKRFLYGDWKTCKYCEGSGKDPELTITCPRCKGEGVEVCDVCDDEGEVCCETCAGSGRLKDYYSIAQHFKQKPQLERYYSSSEIPQHIRDRKLTGKPILVHEWEMQGPLSKDDILSVIEGESVEEIANSVQSHGEVESELWRCIYQKAALYQMWVVTRFCFEYQGMDYSVWMTTQGEDIIEFKDTGFSSAWKNAVNQYCASTRPIGEKISWWWNPIKGRRFDFLKYIHEHKNDSRALIKQPTKTGNPTTGARNFVGLWQETYGYYPPTPVVGITLLALVLPGMHNLLLAKYIAARAYPINTSNKISSKLRARGIVQLLLSLSIVGYIFAWIWALVDIIKIIFLGEREYADRARMILPLTLIALILGAFWYVVSTENEKGEPKAQAAHATAKTTKAEPQATTVGEEQLILEKAEDMERQDNARVVEQMVEALSPKNYVTGKIVMLQERPKKPFVVKKLSDGNMQINGWALLSVNRQLYEEVWQQGLAQRFIAEGVEHAVIERHDYPLRDSKDRMAQQNATLLKELQTRSVSPAVPAPCMYRLNAFAEQCKRWKNVLFVQTGSHSFTAFNIAHPLADLYAAFVKDHTFNMSKMTVEVHLLDNQGNEVKTCYISNIDEGVLWNGGPLYRRYGSDSAVIVSPEFLGSEHERYGQVSVSERLFAFSAELKPEELARVSDITVSVEMPQVSQERIMQYAEYLRKAAEANNDRSSQPETPPQPEQPVVQKPTPAPKPAVPLQPGATQVNLSGLAKQNNQNEAAVPTVKALYEQLSPATCLTGNLVQLSDNQYFRLEKRGSQTELSAWVELRIDLAKYTKLAWLIHEHMKALPHKTLTRRPQAVPQGILNTSKRELNGCEKGDFADVSKQQPHYAFDPKLFSNLHALYLCTRGETFTAYDLSATGQKTPYMLEMLRLQRQKPQQFIVRMHLLNAHNEEVTTFSHLIDLYSDKFNAPLYAGGQHQAPDMVVLPEFSSFLWGNFTPGSGAPHLVTYPSRIIHLSGAINPQDLEEITSVTFSFEWPAALTEQEAQNLAKLYTEQKH